MKKIYLFCSAGMSTSMLASNMQGIANEHRLPIKVAAFPHDKLEEILADDRPDCILLGPQVKYMYEETVDKFGSQGIPIHVIDQADYGMMNGERVLKSAIRLIKENKSVS
ncbi:PTS sugar transporter subunit IIB [Streptococcus panodentis]|uniref:PTS sugar transporter subunit IIB n=1 Tax=Streptococcus panodentis TaxID=1581472 RepID=A0ABS5AWU4_9STRE|nr:MULTISPECIES: PTS sugar transporter subunit IIB [Streptococcus]KXT84625.1 PTS system, cellobiose-specific IIB component [Streptococcus sp. DD11]MBP2620931.1 PTS sugar transporter subunit IIB [Streptococcus panodentis]